MKNDKRLQEVLQIICSVFDVQMEDLFSRKRNLGIVKARHSTYKILFLLGARKVDVAILLDRNHSTVLHGLREFDSLYQYDITFKVMVDCAIDQIIKIKYEETNNQQIEIWERKCKALQGHLHLFPASRT